MDFFALRHGDHVDHGDLSHSLAWNPYPLVLAWDGHFFRFHLSLQLLVHGLVRGHLGRARSVRLGDALLRCYHDD